MSKKLEEAYKEYTQTQIPDLWDRIEAGLPEKKTEGGAGYSKQTDSGRRKKRTKATKNVSVMNKRVYAGIVAAACICLLVAGSGIFHTIGENSENQMTAMDKNAGVTADDAMSESAEPDGIVIMEEATRTESATEDMVADTTENTDEIIWNKEGSADTESVIELEAEDAVDFASQSAQEKEENWEMETEGNSYDVTVTITEIENTGEEILYYAEIVSAQERPDLVDGKVCFCMSDEEFESFEIGKTYSLKLTEREGQGTEIQPYLVTEVYGEQ